MMNGQEKSDSGVVAGKPANKAGKSAAEWVEPRPGTEGNVGQQSTHRTQGRERVTQTLDRIRGGREVLPSLTLGRSHVRESRLRGSVRVAPCKRGKPSRLGGRPRQSLASSRVLSLAWRPVTAAAKRRQGGRRPERK